MKTTRENPFSLHSLPIYPEASRLIVENEHFWVARTEQNELRVFVITTPPTDIPSIEDIFEGLHIFWDTQTSKKRIVCQLENLNIADKFIQVMRHIAGESIGVNSDQLFVLLLESLQAWSEFLRPRRQGLSDNALIGLMGELFVFTEHFLSELDPSLAVDYFTGPDKAPQDFAGSGFALEVKSTEKKTPDALHISSLNQLTTSAEKLGICLIQFNRSQVGFSLQTLLEKAESALISNFGSLMRFRKKVHKIAGLATEAQLQKTFSLHQEKLWVVEGDFPRLTPSSTPAGITRAEYSIQISAIEKHSYDKSLKEFIRV